MSTRCFDATGVNLKLAFSMLLLTGCSAFSFLVVRVSCCLSLLQMMAFLRPCPLHLLLLYLLPPRRRRRPLALLLVLLQRPVRLRNTEPFLPCSLSLDVQILSLSLSVAARSSLESLILKRTP